VTTEPPPLHIAQAVLTTPQDARAAFAWSGHLLEDQGFLKSLAWSRRSRFIAPDGAPPWSREAVVLWRLNRLGAAEVAARRSAILDPGFSSAWINLGAVMKRLGDDDRALRVYRRAEVTGAEPRAAGMNRAVIMLGAGNFRDGWPLYRNRHGALGAEPAAVWPDLAEWDGRAMPGRLRILAEQGIGDAIMFLTLMHGARRHVGAITLLVAPRLATLMRRSFPDVDIVAPDERGQLPSLAPAAAWICSGDLPAVLGLFIDGDLRPRPYLQPDRRRTERLRAGIQRRSPSRRLVGVTWTSRADDGWRRTIPPALWRPLIDTPGIRLVSLQYGASPGDLAAFGDGIECEHGIEPLSDIDGFATLVAAMDMVVSPPNNTVHFAGALDVPCRVLLPEDPDWRWGRGGATSRWYHRTRLYRRSARTDWADMVARIAAELMDPTLEHRS